MTNELHNTDYFIDIFLQPGEFYFGDKETRIRTLLGSCVAITLWHRRLRIGGMCHYLLPMRPGSNKVSDLDGRYADGAIALFMQELNKSQTFPADYEAKMFGGGNQFFTQMEGNPITIPEKNIQVGRDLLKQHGFTVTAEHLGGDGHRNVIFDIWSGQVWIKHVAKYGNI
jgi:chemotaxis protein CheD